MTVTEWDLLATLVAYPDDLFVEALATAKTRTRLDPAVHAAVCRFETAMTPLSLDDLQEAYVATFDFQPACALEMGHHLYGERHERGEFLAQLRGLLQERRVPIATELPDHLSVLLRLIGRAEEECARTVRQTIAPAVERVRDALHARNSPYVHLFDAIREALASESSTAAAQTT